MNVVDSCGWLEYFCNGPNAGEFAVPLQDTENLLVPTLSMYEVFKVALRERGEDAALQAVALMKQGRETPLNGNIAILAAKNSAETKMPMADSIILTTARVYQAIVWTQDDDFAGLDGVRYFRKT